MSGLAEALPEEIKRISAKRERWLGYQREMGPAGVGMGATIALMQLDIDRAVKACAAGDVVEMLAAHATLKEYGDDD